MVSFTNRIIRLILFALILLSSVGVYASEAGVIFLLIEPGSRGNAMGNAHVAQVDCGFAGFWNPGAMAFNRNNQFAFMHSNWLGEIVDDIYYEYLSWNNYFPNLGGNLGFSVVFFHLGEMERRDEQGNFLGTFSSYEIAAAASYAYQHSDNLGLGITFKFILSDLAPSGQGAQESSQKGRGVSFAFDLGLKRKNLLINRLDFGMNLQNIGPDITYIDDEQADPLPMNLRMGFSYRLIESEYNQFTVNADMNKLFANRDHWVLERLVKGWYDHGGFLSKRQIDSTIFGVGAEFVYWNLLALRAGYNYDKIGNIIGPSFGGGIQYTFAGRFRANIDFAMQQGGELVDYNRTITLGLEF